MDLVECHSNMMRGHVYGVGCSCHRAACHMDGFGCHSDCLAAIPMITGRNSNSYMCGCHRDMIGFLVDEIVCDSNML